MPPPSRRPSTSGSTASMRSVTSRRPNETPRTRRTTPSTPSTTPPGRSTKHSWPSWTRWTPAPGPTPGRQPRRPGPEVAEACGAGDTGKGTAPDGRGGRVEGAAREAAAREAAARMAAAAADWLGVLDPAQRAVATGGGPSPDAEADAERRRWFYTPTDHGGLTLGAQRPAQQRLALRLVAAGLSAAGYVTVATIVGLDNVLDQVEGWSIDWGRERGRDPGLYYLRVFGSPGGAGAWGWRFGGHHISLNNLIVDGAVRSVTPCFLGADPAVSPLLGPAPLRPLGGAEDLARELVR